MDIQTLTFDMCRSYVNDLPLAHPVRERLLGYLRARDIKRLCECSSSLDIHSIDIETFRSLLQVEAFFKKNEAFIDEERCLDAAKISFAAAERRCKRANRRLEHHYFHPGRLDPDVEKVLMRATAFIDAVLGDFGKFMDAIPHSVRVTAGATATTSRRKSLPYLKIKRQLVSTPQSRPYIEALFQFFKLGSPKIRPTLMNRVEFVPKNWKTHRTIACEPEGILPFQLAFDTYAKSRLRKFGFDLRDQSRNQRLARLGSIDGSIATIDLKSASDTVSFNSVALLFPVKWFQYLNTMRSSRYICPTSQEMKEYEKFSSMGNGATFCVETLIFAAVLRGCGEKEGAVYGDDICISTDCADLLIRSLQFLGFEINMEKSFKEGPYRESCGTHWFNGHLVTPFYVRGNLELKPFQSHVVNGLARVSIPFGQLWEHLRSFIKSEGLLLTAFNEDSTSGIFISFASSLLAKVTRQQQWIFRSKRYVFRTADRFDYSIRSLLLWYHDSFRVVPSVLAQARVRSRYSIPLKRYSKRKVVVKYCDDLAPDYIPAWSEFVLRESPTER